MKFTVSKNEDAQNLDDIHDSEDKDNSIAASVTLIANDEQAERLVKAEYSGKVHLILENRVWYNECKNHISLGC